jgi:hypothetical protein
MKTSFINTLIVTAALSVISTFAQAANQGDRDYGAFIQATNTSAVSRDTVCTEYNTAKQNGTLGSLNERDYFSNKINHSQVGKTRAEVISDLAMAKLSTINLGRAQ